MTNIFKQIYIRTSGYSYTNMGRLFLRLFVGVMLMQFGLRQWLHFDDASLIFPSSLGMDPATSMTVMGMNCICSTYASAPTTARATARPRRI